MVNKFDVLVIGGGPAGLYSSIVLKRGIPTQNISENVSVGIIDQGRIGGLTKYAHITISKKWGFSGSTLIQTLFDESKDLGTKIIENEQVTEINHHDKYVEVITNKKKYEAKYVLLANGIMHNPDILLKEKVVIGLHSSKFILEDIEEVDAKKALLIGPDDKSMINLKKEINKISDVNIDYKITIEDISIKEYLTEEEYNLYDIIIVDYNSYKVINESMMKILVPQLLTVKGFCPTNEFGQTNLDRIYAAGTTSNIITGVLISLTSALISSLSIGRRLNLKTISEPTGRFPWFPREESWDDSWLPFIEKKGLKVDDEEL